MRVLQLIDSLSPGGAEKMAVNLANALHPHVEQSFLCCTRREGVLKEQILPEINYFFLRKESALDLKAIFRLKKYIQKNKITTVHAHSTSYFLAGILKMSGCGFKLIWHDHYGESEFLDQREYKILKFFSQFFDAIISVNTTLKEWAVKNLNCKDVVEIKNFVATPNLSSPKFSETLNGFENAFKIICVANLRPQKDHHTLLKAFEKINVSYDVSLHLIGEDPGSTYSSSVLQSISNSSKRENIFYYGSRSNVFNLIEQADIGVLSSISEGLPLVLLEYGLAGLPIVTTQVGKCAEVVGNFGKVVPPKDFLKLAKEIKYYIINREDAKGDGKSLKNFIEEQYFKKRIILDFLSLYN